MKPRGEGHTSTRTTSGTRVPAYPTDALKSVPLHSMLEPAWALCPPRAVCLLAQAKSLIKLCLHLNSIAHFYNSGSENSRSVRTPTLPLLREPPVCLGIYPSP